MGDRLSHFVRLFTREVVWKIHGFALGVSLALATPLLSQGCVAGGQ
jgi:demethoxyubiquinone hydroxylase (CLK1/Coq7/Cat5 family)